MSVTDAWKFVVASTSGLKPLLLWRAGIERGVFLTDGVCEIDEIEVRLTKVRHNAPGLTNRNSSEFTRWQVIYISRRPVRALGELPVNGDFERSLEKA